MEEQAHLRAHNNLGTIFSLAVFGLAVGSFLNVLIYRLNTEDKVPRFWQGRSICPKCKHELSWKDNIPLLSFVVLGGRCRYCRARISWQYPVVELATAGTFVLLGQFGKFDLAIAGLASVFIVIFFSDLIYELIPNEMIVAGSFAALIYNLQFTIYDQFLNSNFKFQISNSGQDLLVGILSGLGFLFIVVMTKFRGMGLGDVKLAFLIGFLLGWPKSLVAFWSAFVLGGLVAIGLLVLKRTKLSATIALGPFLVAGVVVSALWSDKLLALLLLS